MERKKIVIVGSGTIGSLLAYSLFIRHEGIEIELINRDEKKSWAKAFDISHCQPELPRRSIRSVNLRVCKDADIVVMTAGTLPSEHGTRSDVLRENVHIFEELLPEIAELNPRAIIVCITNPVDALTYAALRITGFAEARVLGSGTELDGMRLRALAAERFKLDPSRLSIEVIGEHGDTMVPLWSRATYDGKPLGEMVQDMSECEMDELTQRTRLAGWEIRRAGEHSSFAIAFSADRIIEGILGCSQNRITVSSMVDSEYAIHKTCLSLPVSLSPSGILKHHVPEISKRESIALAESAHVVQTQMEEVDRILMRR